MTSVCKVNAPISMYCRAPKGHLISSVIADCPDPVPPPTFSTKFTLVIIINLSLSL